jgi:ketosteroid isomerase-like protein
MGFFATGALALLVITTASAPIAAKPEADADFKAFLATFEAGLDRFVNGNPDIWTRHVSFGGDATVFGEWGGYACGRDVEPSYAWAASKFRESGADVKVEYLTIAVSGDLAYTVSIERSEVRVGDQYEELEVAFRATHVFQRRNGSWKLLHRHADHMAEKTDLPSTRQ